MAIYYGQNCIALGATFQPPRPGTMPKRAQAINIAANGLSDRERKEAFKKSESPGHLIPRRKAAASRKNSW